MNVKIDFRYWILAGLTFLFLASEKCQGSKNAATADKSKSQLKELLFQKWTVEAHQENGKLTILRPEGYELPPSRGRTSFDFKPDGKLIQYDLGPADRPVQREGTWVWNGREGFLEMSVKGEVQRHKLESLEKDKLTLRKADSL